MTFFNSVKPERKQNNRKYLESCSCRYSASSSIERFLCVLLTLQQHVLNSGTLINNEIFFTMKFPFTIVSFSSSHTFSILKGKSVVCPLKDLFRNHKEFGTSRQFPRVSIFSHSSRLGRVVQKPGNTNPGLKFQRNINSPIKMFPTAYVLCSLRLFKLKTKGQTI